MSMYEFIWVRGEHVEVYLNGKFLFSADNMSEARKELNDETVPEA